MLLRLSLLVLVVIAASPALGLDTVRVYFRDKGLSTHDLTPGSAKFEATLARLSTESIARRKQALRATSDWQVITQEDFDVSASYLHALQKLGVHVIHSSRWQNFVSVAAQPEAISVIQQLPFVDRVVSPRRVRTVLAAEDCAADTIVFHRGLAAWQQDRINTGPLQWLGIDATNVKVAYFDTGFIWRNNHALDHLNVIGERDFVGKDSNTAQEPQDHPGQWGHGTSVLGAAAALLPDTLLGAAYAADIILGKTEDLNSETPIEEENYALALEWAEGLGARIASSSLGYIELDSPYVDYTYADLDGQTAVSSKAAARAAQLGMLIVTASGNNGTTPFPWVNAPADADSILAVGAIAFSDTVVPFTAHGPTPDGRTKPEILAPGVWVWTYDPLQNIPIGATGTSLATPLVSSAASLIMKAHPQATAQEIREAILATGTKANEPDSLAGWGVMDTYAAALELGPFFGRVSQKFDQNVLDLCVGFASKASLKTITLWHRRNGGEFFPATLDEQADSNFYATTQIFGGKPGDTVQYYITETSSDGDTLTLPNGFPTMVYQVAIGDSVIRLDVADPNAPIMTRVRVYPNPAADFVEISAERNIAHTELLDVLGRAIMTSPSQTERSKRFMLIDVASGSYMLRVTFVDGTQEVHQLRIAR